MDRKRVLYITHNGLGDHIGQSQVVPYLLGLAKRGYRITVLSAEKREAMYRRETIALTLRKSCIEWEVVSYHNKPPLLSTVLDLARMYFRARAIIRKQEIGLIHCRSFLPTYLGLLLKRHFGVPVMFDFRDFWADRGIYQKRFKWVYRFFKKKEGQMVRESDHVVTLTRRAREILRSSYLNVSGHDAERRLSVIPTCVDLSLFDVRAISPLQREETRESVGIERGAFVLGYLGSYEEDYLPSRMFQAFLALRELRPNAVFLFVTPSSPDEIRRGAEASGVPVNALRIVFAPRQEVPRWLSVFDMSLVFIRGDDSTAGVSPTKFAELLACDIPLLVSAGVGDLDEISSSGTNDAVIVHDFMPGELRAALAQVLRIVDAPCRRGREAAATYSLEKGVSLYAAAYSQFVRPEEPECLT